MFVTWTGTVKSAGQSSGPPDRAFRQAFKLGEWYSICPCPK